jgi:hypothetical protein
MQKIQHHMALRVILHHDIAMESKTLYPEERDIRERLKIRVIGLAALERARKNTWTCRFSKIVC